jgi:16S rRNA (cytidine1402-2'-O)-methyltransferase
MAGVLKIVCTPIGNLGDMSPRAVNALKTSSVILAENTLHSRKLLAAMGVGLDNIKLISCAQHDEERRVDVVLERLEAGEHVSLISDAGAPGISDPGGRLTEAIVKAGHNIEVIPGPSAVIAALMGAGVVSHHFAFLGFLPKKGKERERLIKDSRAAGFAIVLYESPNRVLDTLEDLHKLCGARRVVVARELTKQFETFHRGVLGGELSPVWVNKGEAVIVVEGGEDEAKEVSPHDINELIETLLARGEHTPKEVAKQIAQAFGLTSKAAYSLVLEHKKTEALSHVSGKI